MKGADDEEVGILRVALEELRESREGVTNIEGTKSPTVEETLLNGLRCAARTQRVETSDPTVVLTTSYEIVELSSDPSAIPDGERLANAKGSR